MQRFFLWLACRIPTVQKQIDDLEGNLDFEQGARLRYQQKAADYKDLAYKYGPGEGTRIEVRSDHEVAPGIHARVAMFGSGETPYIVPDCSSIQIDTADGKIVAYCDNKNPLEDLRTEEALLNMEIDRLQAVVHEAEASLEIAQAEMKEAKASFDSYKVAADFTGGAMRIRIAELQDELATCLQKNAVAQSDITSLNKELAEIRIAHALEAEMPVSKPKTRRSKRG